MEERDLGDLTDEERLKMTIYLLTDEAKGYPKSGDKHFIVGFSYNGKEKVISHVLSDQSQVKDAVTTLTEQAKGKKYVGWFIVPMNEGKMREKLDPFHTRFFDEEDHLREVL